jgi:ubiquitin C-terminal hydrolase
MLFAEIMSSKMKYTPKQRLYKLFAVVYHEGVEAVKGHYLTDTYHGQVGWIRYAHHSQYSPGNQ